MGSHQPALNAGESVERKLLQAVEGERTRSGAAHEQLRRQREADISRLREEARELMRKYGLSLEELMGDVAPAAKLGTAGVLKARGGKEQSDLISEMRRFYPESR